MDRILFSQRLADALNVSVHVQVYAERLSSYVVLHVQYCTTASYCGTKTNREEGLGHIDDPNTSTVRLILVFYELLLGQSGFKWKKRCSLANISDFCT